MGGRRTSDEHTGDAVARTQEVEHLPALANDQRAAHPSLHTSGLLAATTTVSMTQEREVTGAAVNAAQAEQLAQQNAERAKDAIRRAATTALSKAEGDVRAALDATIQRVYLKALEQKARSMG